MEENKNEIPWWENKEFIKELDQEYADWKSGKVKGYSIEEANASIEELRIKQDALKH
jgi:hypothetical protein